MSERAAITNLREPGSSRRISLSRQDILLIVVGVVSAVVYLFGQPSVNPDRLSTNRMSDAGAVEIATSFVSEHGFDISAARTTVSRRRNSELLTLLQNAVGRATLMESEAELLQERMPLHYTVVRFGSERGSASDLDIEVRLTGAGRPWNFTSGDLASLDGDTESRAIDRAALSAVLSGGEDSQEGVRVLSDFDAMADSIVARRLIFNPRLSSLAGGFDPPPREVDTTRPASPDRPNRIVLGRDDAAALARYHLRRYGLPEWDLEMDSVWVVPGERAAHVRFAATDNETGVVNRTEVVVAPTGGLRKIVADLASKTKESGTSLGLASVVIAGSLYLLLGIILLVVFFRRLLSRAIDVKAALIDGLVFSILFVMFVLTSRGALNDGGSLLIRLVGTAALVVIGGTAVAMVAFLMSGAADSFARRGWSAKLLSTSLLRQGSLLNGFVGASVIRGLAIGLAVLAVTTTFMWMFGDVAIELDSTPIGERSMMPVVGAVGMSGLIAYAQTIVVVLTVAAIFFAPGRSAWIPVLGIVFASTLGLASPVTFGSAWITWAASAAIGFVIALTFWKFDALAVFSALSSSSLVWLLQEGWLVRGSPVLVDLLVAGLFLATVVTVGFVGISRGRNVPGVGEFVPSYIRELRQQERLQRELEIAHQVQESFLPHEMPDVEHLDIAATCIAAEDVGGDYYDLIRLDDNNLALAIGDVSGKGIQAAFFMTLTKGFLRSLCREQSSPAEVLRRMNRLFVESAPKGVFISIVYGIIDVRRHEFLFARAGHNPVILRKANGDARRVQPPGMGIGLDSGGRFDQVIAECRISIEPGDILIFYTDGFSEARNHGHEEFGDERLLRAVSSANAETARTLLDDVCGVVDRFVKGAERHDDMTMLVVRLTGREPASKS